MYSRSVLPSAHDATGLFKRPRTSGPMVRDMQHDVVIIGAGQAGLAVGYYLAEAGLDFAILDAGRRVGDSWRKWWDSLRLFTPGRYNALPGAPPPGDPTACPGKDELADYLEAYAARWQLPVQLRTPVRRLRRTPAGFELDTPQGLRRARIVVVATGSHATEVVPSFASELEPSIHQATAATYRNPAQLPTGDTLVVGAGNSGVQIAMELAATRPTALAGRDTGRIPRRILGIDVFRWMDHLGLVEWDAQSWAGRRIVAQVVDKGDPVVGLTRRRIEASGVTRVPPVVGVVDGRPQLRDGRLLDVRAVVWCCGIRPDFGWIEGVTVDARGNPKMHRGRSEELEDLYFAGLRFQMRLGSGLVGGVGRDARELAESIAARLAAVTSGGHTRGPSAPRPGDPGDGALASSSTSE
jgi:putative flavoprotein involved in K+ transport